MKHREKVATSPSAIYTSQKMFLWSTPRIRAGKRILEALKQLGCASTLRVQYKFLRSEPRSFYGFPQKVRKEVDFKQKIGPTRLLGDRGIMEGYVALAWLLAALQKIAQESHSVARTIIGVRWVSDGFQEA